MTTTQTTGKAPTKLQQEAMQLFGVASVDKISTVLWALGIRRACGRCNGSGHYSRNSMGETRCYDCKGKKEAAAKLTRETLDAARAKVEAGELAACRARGAARIAACKAVKAKMAEEHAAAACIADAYMAGDRAVDGNKTWCDREGILSTFVNSPVFRARGMSIAVSRCAFEASLAVEFHGLDPVEACRRIDACTAMQLELRAAWQAWERAEVSRLRAGAHARLAA